MEYHPTWHEYNAALHLLTAPLIRGRTARYIEPNGFDWDGLLDNLIPVLSPAEGILVSGAFDLWGGTRDDPYRPVNVRDVAIRLDEANRGRFICAVMILGGDYSRLPL